MDSPRPEQRQIEEFRRRERIIRSVHIIYRHHVVASASEVRDADAEGVDLTRYGLNIAGGTDVRVESWRIVALLRFHHCFAPARVAQSACNAALVLPPFTHLRVFRLAWLISTGTLKVKWIHRLYFPCINRSSLDDVHGDATAWADHPRSINVFQSLHAQLPVISTRCTIQSLTPHKHDGMQYLLDQLS
jgi:hypothetical protein